MLRARHHIDTWKGSSALWLLGILLYHRQWNNVAAVALTAMFCTYGPMWLVKSELFPDKNWEKPMPLLAGVQQIWALLIPYAVGPWLMMSRSLTLPPWVVGLFLFLFIWGVFLHYVSDAHKHFVLAARPGLVTDGLWRVSRNVNYLGELFIYLAFAGIPAAALRSLWPLLPLCISVCAVWVPNMKNKDRSLSRYPEFAAWKKHAAFWLPFLWLRRRSLCVYSASRAGVVLVAGHLVDQQSKGGSLRHGCKDGGVLFVCCPLFYLVQQASHAVSACSWHLCLPYTPRA